MPSSLKFFSLTVFLGLSTIFAFNYWEDPGHQWHRELHYISRALAPGEVWAICTPDFPDRPIRLSQIKYGTVPDVVAMGSSRALLIDSRLFNSNLHMRNVSVLGASLEDEIGLWQFLILSGKQPHYVVLFVDPWILNRNIEQTRWLQFLTYYNAFFSAQPITLIQRLSLRVIEAQTILDARLNTLVDFWSWLSLKASVKVALHPAQTQIAPEVYPEKLRPATFFGYRSDGSYFFPDAVVAKRPKAAVEVDARNYALQPKITYLSNWELNVKAITDLDLLLKDMSRHGTHALIVLPPFHPTARQILNQRPGYNNLLNESSQIIHDVVIKNENATLCDAIEAEKVGCLGDEFIDGSHLAYPCVQKVIRYCLQTSQVWVPMLNNSSTAR